MIWHNWPLKKKPNFGQQITFNYKVFEDLRKKPKTPRWSFNSNNQKVNCKGDKKFQNISIRKENEEKRRSLPQVRERCIWRTRDVDGSHCLLLEATNSSKIKIAFWFLKNQNGVSLYIVGEKKTNWKRSEDERDDEPTANCMRKREILVKRTWHCSVPNQ